MIVLRICIFPYKEDLFQFDFEVDEEDDYMCQVIGNELAKAFMTPLLDE